VDGAHWAEDYEIRDDAMRRYLDEIARGTKRG
jgi:hypothetical protein